VGFTSATGLDFEDTNLVSWTYTAPCVLGVLSNDTDADGDPLTALIADAPAHGSVQLNGDGSFGSTPNETFAGQDPFTYTVSDATFTIGVGPPVITAPFLPNGLVGTPYTARLSVVGNFGAITWTLDTGGNPALNWLSLSSDGVLSGTPTAYGNTPSFTVTATD